MRDKLVGMMEWDKIAKKEREKNLLRSLGFLDVQRAGTFWTSALVTILILGNPCDFGIIQICPLVLTVCIILSTVRTLNSIT